MNSQSIRMLDINWEYLRWNALLSTKRRLLYVATPKVACTSIKWWFARLEGYCGALHAVSEDSKETAPELVIHDSLHKAAPLAAGLAPESLAGAVQSDEYFRFALVRNPFKRIFSAWQSKLFLREPLQVVPYRDKVFYHHPVRSKTDVAQAFEMFLEHLAAEESPTFWDVHWTPQALLLRPDMINYTVLSQIENVSDLERNLGRWLGEEVPSPFVNRMSNESILPYQEEFVSTRSAELIRQLYAADFEQFGYVLELPTSSRKLSSGEFELALKAIEMIRGRHERIGVMRVVAERRLHDLQVESAVKDKSLSMLRQVVAEAVNQHTQLHWENLGALNAKLDRVEANWLQVISELEDSKTQCVRYADELAVSEASRQQLASILEKSEADRSQLAIQLEQTESKQQMLVEHSAAVETRLARQERELAENERTRASLQDELDRAALALRRLREEVGASHPPEDSSLILETQEPADLIGEIEKFREQLAPLQRLSVQVGELHRVVAQHDSIRFLAKQSLVVLGKRIVGRRG